MNRFDLAFRPDDYWAPPDPITLITATIKGARRREFVREILAGKHEMELTPTLMSHSLTAMELGDWARSGPSWVGGEALPDCLAGEIEMARIVINSPCYDVISLRARRSDGQVAYRMVDERDNTYRLLLDATTRPVLFRVLIAMLDGAVVRTARGEKSVLETLWSRPMDRMRWATFVQSPFYPQLEAWYRIQEARHRGWDWGACPGAPGHSSAR
jgi:hypothetical protein